MRMIIAKPEVGIRASMFTALLLSYSPNQESEKQMEDPLSKEVEQPGNLDIILEMTSEVVSAYVGNNPVSTNELPVVIGEVYAAFAKAIALGHTQSSEPPKPAVSVKKSINDDYLICLEDGLKFKSLKRHLRSHFDLSPEEYREKWGLPRDYPMVAPNYAKARSRLAREMGLGRKPGTKIRK